MCMSHEYWVGITRTLLGLAFLCFIELEVVLSS